MRTEAAREKRRGKRTRGEEKQLRLDAVDPRRGLQRLQQVMQQRIADRVSVCFRFPNGEDVADDAFDSFIDAEGVSDDAALM